MKKEPIPPDIYQRLHLLPYQSAFAANEDRFKIGLWARQTGKDHTAAAEAVIDCLYRPGTTWIILAAGERQALESLNKAKEWAEILKFDIAEYLECPANLPLASVRAASTEIKWSNGSRLLALPANPQTIRGYCANLILTEFAFHEDADAIWRAIYPSISNPLRGGLKKLRIISTPNGLNNKFADLWFNAADQGSAPVPGAVFGVPPNAEFPSPDCPFWSGENGHGPVQGSNRMAGRHARQPGRPPYPSRYHKSKITIHDAIRYGLPLDADELRAGLNDEEAWSQEYLCEFMDTSTVMFPYDLIGPCESSEATESAGSGAQSAGSQLYAGIDFGRKHHLTVCWIIERIPALGRAGVPPAVSVVSPAQWTFLTREVLCLKNTSTPDQLEILRPRLQRCRRICLDYTGAGVGLGDYLVKQFGEAARPAVAPYLGRAGSPSTPSGKIDLCPFTTALKAELFPRLRAAFEQRILRIPISREIREDLHAIQRTVTHSGQITYRAPQSADGHSDRTTALALALRAASSAPVYSGGATIVRVPGRTADLRWALRAPRASRRRICL